MPGRSTPRRVALVTLGCTRNDVDSEELAGRLRADGWDLVDDAADADVALVNTCGFIEQAKKDSIDALLEAADLKDATSGARTRAVVAVGCLAERYGEQLAAQLPEACIQLVPTTDRAAVGHMLSGMAEYLDVIVPRGGKSLVERVQRGCRSLGISKAIATCTWIAMQIRRWRAASR